MDILLQLIVLSLETINDVVLSLETINDVVTIILLFLENPPVMTIFFVEGVAG